MGQTKEFRNHFKRLLAETRHTEVSYHEVDILIDLINRVSGEKGCSVDALTRLSKFALIRLSLQSADVLREQRKHSQDTSEELIYRKVTSETQLLGELVLSV